MAKNISTTQNGEEFVISFKDTHNTIVNSVRRIILDEVPTFAIEDVEVVKNETPIYSETIAHRLGLVPLKTDLKSYNFKNACPCGGVGCALCEVKLTLKQEEEGYVFSELIKSDDPQIVPADTRIPVAKLFPGKVLELNLKAVLGCGREHAKWAPAHTFLREGDNQEVMLVIESFGQLESKEIYNTAVDILLSKIDELESNLQTI
jgi:DNA-directed RNA polymerase subunit D